ncbi:MAG: hypothetical protein ACI4XN_06485 [Candidatus Kurthia intestinigallinarum]|uniref:DUF7352 domain-containing protein n=1 Tax=Kurthia sp. Dielmo TaxID=1033738 RepID=UPI001121DFF2|nr:hypothetical protein [Kurthia sp. Dielmo]
MKVYKYPVRVNTVETIDLPLGAKPLSIAFQYDKVYIYALVKPEEQKTVSVQVIVAGTGEPLPEDIDTFTYLNTIQMFDQQWNLHGFYKK